MNSLQRLSPERTSTGLASRGALLAIAILGLLVSAAPAAWASLGFIENRGQVDERVRYYAQLGGTTAFFTDDGIVFDLRVPIAGSDEAPMHSRRTADLSERRFHGHSVVLGFQERSATVSFAPSGERVTKLNYFGPIEDAAGGGSEGNAVVPPVRVFDQLTVREVWPGIDLIFHIDGRSLVYETRMGADADPSSIDMDWEGAPVDLLSAESVRVQTTAGALQASRNSEGGRIDVSSGEEEPGSPLDPAFFRGSALQWSSFLGGSSDEIGWGLALDSQENVVVTGLTLPWDFHPRWALMTARTINSGMFSSRSFRLTGPTSSGGRLSAEPAKPTWTTDMRSLWTIRINQ